jgi:exodeoxyribonuclease-5
VLHHLLELARPIAERYRERKRTAARLDFNDLIIAARDLLRGTLTCAAPRSALPHLLVDEFQDTDPDQTEIFWRLRGPDGARGRRLAQLRDPAGRPVSRRRPQAGHLSLPRADVAAYVEARDRSSRPIRMMYSRFHEFPVVRSILTFVNERSSLTSQPMASRLHQARSLHPDWEPGPCVAALDIACANEEGTASAEVQRDCEPRRSRNCGPADREPWRGRPPRRRNAAVPAWRHRAPAPTGAELWRYEEALERHGVPVATQAGKGSTAPGGAGSDCDHASAGGRSRPLALARCFADARRLTEEELLDLVWSHRGPGATDIPRARHHLDLEHVGLRCEGRRRQPQLLRRRINSTTPHHSFRRRRHAAGFGPFSCSGMAARPNGRSPMSTSSSRWRGPIPDGAACLLGRDAVGLGRWQPGTRRSTRRAGRGGGALHDPRLQGPGVAVVMPINTMTKVTNFEEPIVERGSGRVFMPVMGVAPPGYSESGRGAAGAGRERERLWYVAATRARELSSCRGSRSARQGQLGGSSWTCGWPRSPRSTRPALLVGFDPAEPTSRTADAGELCGGGRCDSGATRPLAWLAPSRDEDPAAPLASVPEVSISADGEAPADPPVPVQGVASGARPPQLLRRCSRTSLKRRRTRSASARRC